MPGKIGIFLVRVPAFFGGVRADHAPNNAHAARNRRHLSLKINAITSDFFWLAVKRDKT
jgi:hypothetical protein